MMKAAVNNQNSFDTNRNFLVRHFCVWNLSGSIGGTVKWSIIPYGAFGH